MPTRSRLWATALLSLPALLAACGDDEPRKKKPRRRDDDEETAKPESKGTATAVSTGAATPPAGGTPPPAGGATAGGPGGGGRAYFVLANQGLVELGPDGKFTVIPETESEYFQPDALTAGPDGALYVTTARGVRKLVGGKLQDVAPISYQNLNSAQHVAITKDGKVWATSFKGVGFYDGSSWKIDERKVFGGESTYFQGIAIDSKGRPWIATNESFWVRDNNVWTEVKPPKAKPYITSLKGDAAGNVYATASLPGKFWKIDTNKQITEFDTKTTGYASVDRIDTADDGTVAYRWGKNVTTHKGVPKIWSGDKDFPVDVINALAVDNLGRAWVATYSGVVVLGPAGAKTEIPMGTFPEIAGEIREIEVLGGGPAIPASSGVKKAKSLKGKVLVEGEAIANTPVEACPWASWFISKTPCEQAPIKFSGQTNAQGEFEFKDVPLGTYQVAVKLPKDGKWYVSGERAKKMSEGKDYDIGSIKITPRK